MVAHVVIQQWILKNANSNPEESNLKLHWFWLKGKYERTGKSMKACLITVGRP